MNRRGKLPGSYKLPGSCALRSKQQGLLSLLKDPERLALHRIRRAFGKIFDAGYRGILLFILGNLLHRSLKLFLFAGEVVGGNFPCYPYHFLPGFVGVLEVLKFCFVLIEHAGLFPQLIDAVNLVACCSIVSGIF